MAPHSRRACIGTRVEILDQSAGGIVAWFVYELPPIDFWWEFLPTVADVAVGMASGGAREAVTEHSSTFRGVVDLNSTVTFVRNFREAQDLAGRHGWEGDFSMPARVLWLPEENSPVFSHAFVWKQDNNGTTYVVSPHPLPWLGEPAQPRTPRR
jgi:hypothetical protein